MAILVGSDERPYKRSRLVSHRLPPTNHISSPHTIAYHGRSGMVRNGWPWRIRDSHGQMRSDHSCRRFHDVKGKYRSRLSLNRRDSRNSIRRGTGRVDDENGHFSFEVGDNLTSRYKILRKMGEGTFSRVVECWDRDSQESVAIKVIHNVQKYSDAAMIEIDVLRMLAKNDRSGTCGCVRMKHWFDYDNHICIVFDLLGQSVYDFMKRNDYRPFPISFVREFGRQLIEAISYMHDLTLIHTDLKPENIVLVSSDYIRVPVSEFVKDYNKRYMRVPTSSDIKLIDFGSATFEDEHHSSVVSTRHYRAPEVILGLGWSYPCDLWSVGCILVELCTGDTLFQTNKDLEHLAMMERVLGRLPPHMIIKAAHTAEMLFRRECLELCWPEGASSRKIISDVEKLPRLHNLVMQHVDHSAGAFIDLVRGLLEYDPAERLTAREALRHPFFQHQNLSSKHGRW